MGMFDGVMFSCRHCGCVFGDTHWADDYDDYWCNTCLEYDDCKICKCPKSLHEHEDNVFTTCANCDCKQYN